MGFKLKPENETSCKRKISGKSLTGTKLALQLGPITQISEFYSFVAGKKTIVAILQTSEEDAKKSEENFKVITESLK